MGKVANAITMASLLSNGRKYTVNELASYLEVTPRMIRFYKDELEKCGIYIDTIRGPYGGYVLNQSIRIPSRKFNIDDVELLKSLSIANPKLENEILILRDKIRGLYQNNENESIELKGDNLNKYNVIARAVKEKRKVKILYYLQ